MDSKNEFSKKLLRAKAEVIAAKKNKEINLSNQQEVLELLQELQIHQIELKMQNEQLTLIQEQLLSTKKELTQIFEQAPIGYLILNSKAEILKSNYAIQELLGYQGYELDKLRYFSHFIYQNDLVIFNSRYPAFFKYPENKIITLRLRNKKAQIIAVELTGRLIKPVTQKKHSDINHLLLNIVDISSHESVEEELRLAAKVFENSDEAIMIADNKTHILKINPAFTLITGYNAEDVIGKSISNLKSNHQSTDFYNQMWSKINSEGKWQGEIWSQRKNGETYLELLNINVIYDQYGKPHNYIGFFTDITEKRKIEERVELMANYDSLTELPNRMLFNERLKQYIIFATRHNQWISVLFLDLDRFKILNDTLGHFIGDLLLQSVAKRLKLCVRQTDTVARFGGDEFVIVLSEFENKDVAMSKTIDIAKRILKELAKPFDLAGNKFITSTSIGFAFFPKDGCSVAELVKNADTAMYYAKSQGRNNYQYYSEIMREQALARSSLENDLRSAMENNELVLYYQPIVNLQNSELIGFEALIRWHHRKLGLIMPDQFIPIAEETGLIVNIGEWVLYTACYQLKQWHEKGSKVKVAVNLSARQFLQQDLFSLVSNILLDLQLEAKYLELEITETTLMRNMSEAIKVLTQLKNLGVSISLDDFGTGYSSLTYLKQFPINVLKIDKSFIKDILTEHDDQVIVNSIIAIAKQMKLEIITEGIEQEEQAAYLRDLGCHFGQGYFFTVPRKAEECFLNFQIK